MTEVVRQLNDMAKQFDPDKTGVVISVSTNSVDGPTEMESLVAINIPLLSDVQLADVLDAIVLVADKPIEHSIEFDGSVIFSTRPTAYQLYSRTFKVYPEMFASESNQVSDAPHPFLGTTQTAIITTDASRFIANLGVDLKSPSGKAVFYNDRLGKLFVKATQSDLDKIEKAFSKCSLPQIHIKARFMEVPKTDNEGFYLGGIITNGAVGLPVSSWQSVGNITNLTNPMPPGWMCVVTPEKLKEVFNTLWSRAYVEYLAEPEVTTASGRQTQLRATQIRNLDPDYGKGLAISGPASLDSPSDLEETGPILEVVPSVLSDGNAINLQTTFAVTEVAGSNRTTNTSPSNTNARARVDTSKFVVKLRGWQAVVNLNLRDGQLLFSVDCLWQIRLTTGSLSENRKLVRK